MKASRLGQIEGASLTQGLVAECVDAMTHAVGQGHEQSVVGDALEVYRAPHLEAHSVAEQHKRNVPERMAVALAEFVGPDDGGVVEQTAIGSGLGRLGQALGQVGQFAGKPFVDAEGNSNTAKHMSTIDDMVRGIENFVRQMNE